MGRRTRPTWPDPDDPLGAVDQILADPGFVWFGVKHYSPACALHVRRTILEREPVAVLIEGPDDANELIPWMVHADTRPPFTVLSSWVDKRNKLGRNGELSAAPDVPARYRGWWPFVSHGPEYAAVRAGHEVGARVAFIDASLKAQLPTMHGAERQPNDRDLGESAYVKALEEAGVMVGGGALMPPGTGTTVRVRGARRQVQDGPFAATKEQLGGYVIVDVANLDEAIAIAERFPAAKRGTVEIRPLFPLEGIPVV